MPVTTSPAWIPLEAAGLPAATESTSAPAGVGRGARGHGVPAEVTPSNPGLTPSDGDELVGHAPHQLGREERRGTGQARASGPLEDTHDHLPGAIEERASDVGRRERRLHARRRRRSS